MTDTRQPESAHVSISASATTRYASTWAQYRPRCTTRSEHEERVPINVSRHPAADSVPCH